MSMIEELNRLSARAESDPAFKARLEEDPEGTLDTEGFQATLAEVRSVEASIPDLSNISEEKLKDDPKATLTEAGMPTGSSTSWSKRWKQVAARNETVAFSGPWCIAAATVGAQVTGKAAYSIYTSRVKNLDCPWRRRC